MGRNTDRRQRSVHRCLKHGFQKLDRRHSRPPGRRSPRTDDCKKASERITANKKGPVYRASLWNKTWNWHRIGTGLHKEHLELFVARIGRILSIRAVRPNLLRSASSLSKSRQEISPIGFFRKTMEAMAPFPERLTSAESALLRNASDSNTAAKTAANVL